MISAVLLSSIKCAISVFPNWVTSSAGPEPSFEIANRSVIITSVSIVLTLPNILRSPDISKLEVNRVLLKYTSLFTDNDPFK